MFKPVMQQVSQEMGVAVNYINVDYDATFAQKYSVTSIPTIVITDNNGSQVFKHTGAMSAQQLKETFARFR